MSLKPNFIRYIGIDYSGAETADSSCKGSAFTPPRVPESLNRFSLHPAHAGTGRGVASPSGFAKNSGRSRGVADIDIPVMIVGIDS